MSQQAHTQACLWHLKRIAIDWRIALAYRNFIHFHFVKWFGSWEKCQHLTLLFNGRFWISVECTPCSMLISTHISPSDPFKWSMRGLFSTLIDGIDELCVCVYILLTWKMMRLSFLEWARQVHIMMWRICVRFLLFFTADFEPVGKGLPNNLCEFAAPKESSRVKRMHDMTTTTTKTILFPK